MKQLSAAVAGVAVAAMCGLKADVARADGPTATQLQGVFAAGSTTSATDAYARQLAQAALPAASVGVAGGAAAFSDSRIVGALQAAGGDASATVTTATGGTVSRTQAARAADVINVRDYGAVGDGVTDDAASINGAIAAARARSSSDQSNWRIYFPLGVYLVKSTINLTSIQTLANVIDGGGSVLLAQTSGTPAIDALGSRWLRLRDLTIIGSAAAMPNIGIQLGRTDTTGNNSSDNNALDNIVVEGSYTFTAIYNLNSETMLFDHVFAWNAAAGDGRTTGFALVQDGLNHWNAASRFVTEKQPVETAESFNENLFLNCDFRTMGGGTPIWTAQTSRNRYVASYAANTAGPYGVIVYSGASGDKNLMLDMDIHFETGSLTDVFLLSGPATTQYLDGFHYRDQNPFASNSVFKLDTGVAAVYANNINLEVPYLSGTAKFFDAPASWHVAGEIWTDSSTAWNLSAANTKGIVASGTGTNLFPTTITLPGDSNGVSPVLSASTAAAGVQVSTGLKAVTLSTAGGIYAPLFYTGTDTSNGSIELGNATGTSVGTPYIDFLRGNGTTAARIIEDAAGLISINPTNGYRQYYFGGSSASFSLPLVLNNGLTLGAGSVSLSHNDAVTAAGTGAGASSSGAFQIATQQIVITTCPSGAGVILPAYATAPGAEIKVRNRAANACFVYPQAGARIESGATGSGVSLAANADAVYEISSAVQVYD